MSCQVFLPAYTAAAHFHRKLPPDLQADLPKALAEAREFMRTEYAWALFQGTSLTAAERARVAAKLARLTGLPPRVVEDNNLRIDGATFRKELLRDQGLILGRFDARITGRDANAASRHPGFDPSLSTIDGAFSAAMNAYVRGELKFENDLPYGILSQVAPWPFGPRDGHPTSVSREFASEMEENPHLRVLVLNGRCDLACPVDGLRYNIDHLSLDPAYRRNITYAEYDAGHMMYVNPPDLRKMQKDIEQFIRPRQEPPLRRYGEAVECVTVRGLVDAASRRVVLTLWARTSAKSGETPHYDRRAVNDCRHVFPPQGPLIHRQRFVGDNVPTQILFRPLAQALERSRRSSSQPRSLSICSAISSALSLSIQIPFSPMCSGIPAFFVAITGNSTAAAVAAASPAKLPVKGSTHSSEDRYWRKTSGMGIWLNQAMSFSNPNWAASSFTAARSSPLKYPCTFSLGALGPSRVFSSAMALKTACRPFPFKGWWPP